MAYHSLEPFGELRADYRAALIAQTIANVNRSKGQDPYKLEDFLINFEGQEEKPQQAPDDHMQLFKMITAGKGS